MAKATKNTKTSTTKTTVTTEEVPVVVEVGNQVVTVYKASSNDARKKSFRFFTNEDACVEYCATNASSLQEVEAICVNGQYKLLKDITAYTGDMAVDTVQMIKGGLYDELTPEQLKWTITQLQETA